jgi:phage FluMu gp28-like protein
LILDEFAFHEDSAAIWEAAEPILSSNPDFLCRIASTGNGKHNMFYQMANGELRMTNLEKAECRTSNVEHPMGEGSDTSPSTSPPVPLPLASQCGEGSSEPEIFHTSAAGFKVSRVTRTRAHELGVPVYDARTRAAITPEAARARAPDKRAYDQNYECVFADENLTLLSHELISAAEAEGVGEICEQDWRGEALTLLKKAQGDLFAGFDVARKGDLSVITVIEKIGGMNFVRAILRIQDMRLPEQQIRLGEVCRLPKFRRAAIDMTGLGLGLFEYAQKEFGGRIQGINFAATVPVTDAIAAEGRKRETVRVTEALALELLRAYEDGRMRQPADARLRDDLRQPEKVTTPGGRVSIAATRTEAGHADHFWSLALALEAAGSASGPFAWEPIKLSGAGGGSRGVLM